MSGNKDARKQVEKIVKALQKDGFQVEKTRASHWKITHPEKRGIVFMGSTPSDPRAVKNFRADLNREFGWKK